MFLYEFRLSILSVQFITFDRQLVALSIDRLQQAYSVSSDPAQ
jgi:hypothetical protein